MGATGYAGAELARILYRHPRVRVTSVASIEGVGQRLGDYFPHLRPFDLTIKEELDEVEVIFAALPHAVAAKLLLPYIERGLPVIDLSADFRLKDAAEYESWYKTEHPRPELLKEAVYGLPELHREKIRGAELVANPGCYPTASLLALAPLAAEGLLADVVVDAKQGVSGAGRGAGEETQYVSMDENAFAYKTGGHRHRPEIEQELDGLGNPVEVTFVPHLLPLDQGELVSCYARPTEAVDEGAVLALYRERYATEPFVRVVERPPGLRDVRDTNECHVFVTVEERGRVLIFAAIDNLWKGASSQAVQNLNLMLGLDEGMGIS
jgi:N-acetyl-gamma-glutamyl-phosphate reductase